MTPVDGSNSSVLKCKVRTVTSKSISIISTNPATALTVTQPTAATVTPKAKKAHSVKNGLRFNILASIYTNDWNYNVALSYQPIKLQYPL
ncbi:hypothetical protein [Moritella viscosa]|uniref:hypothetical protein n=1 Tax=Moritella viscosa TaxID=80854 RepID=UPI00094C9301|nr:hypothetical protein [Moritella viscosa]